jgi:hypothetical protein
VLFGLADGCSRRIAGQSTDGCGSRRWVLFRGLKSATFPNDDFKKRGALRLAAARLGAAVVSRWTWSRRTDSCTSALEGITDRSETSRHVRSVPTGNITQSHSITSSAVASSVGGISRPSILAVLRLITNSYLVGACTGSSLGFAPLRMRSTYVAARLKRSVVFGP